jgi:2',3'-cyclic-nucleotide 2'-phosphodiesterase (5'-nucleotidase family)
MPACRPSRRLPPDPKPPLRMPIVARGIAAALIPLVLSSGTLIVSGCGHARQTAVVQQVDGQLTRINATLPDDAATDALIAPYRTTVNGKMQEPLALCPVPMERGNPEGLLGSLVAGIVLERARSETGLPVDACVLNNGGLRIPWPQGVITLGLVYEVMPFDNAITVVRLSAAQMETLANEIASHDGEPVSGVRLRILEDGKHAADVRVAGEPLGSRDYWVATHDYLASGGGGLSALWEPLETRATTVLVRDAIVDALRAYGGKHGADGSLGALPVPEMGQIVRAGVPR